MTIAAKDIREDIARAKAFAQRDDLLRSLAALRNALAMLAKSKVFGIERFEIDALMEEALREVCSHHTMKRVLPGGLKHVRGKEVQLFKTVKKLHEKLGQAMEKARVQRQRSSMAELDDLLIAAQDQIKEKDEMEARKLFRKAAERFKDIPGLYSDIGARMMMGGLVQEAVEYLNRALEQNPRDQRAHSSLITCLEGLGDPVKTELAIKSAIKYLGKHETLLVRLARLSLAQRNWNQAFEMAEQVLEKNPLSAPARKVYDQAKPKVYRPSAGVSPKSSSSGGGGGAPSSAPSGSGGEGKPKGAPIKLDF